MLAESFIRVVTLANVGSEEHHLFREGVLEDRGGKDSSSNCDEPELIEDRKSKVEDRGRP